MKLISSTFRLQTNNGWLTVEAQKTGNGMDITFRTRKCFNGICYNYPRLNSLSPTRIKNMISTDREISEQLGLEYLHINYLKRQIKHNEIYLGGSRNEYYEGKNEEYQKAINELTETLSK